MPTKVEETGRLALRAASGEQKAFDELYAATVETAYYTATLVLTSQEDIADALQISYMKAFAHIGELEHPESFEKWLKKIVINECRNYLRDNGKHIFSTVYIGGSYDDVEGSDLTVDIAGNEELRRTLDEILSSLPEKQRVCVNLFYYEKYSVTEIAALLGISEGTVKSRLHYGRRTLERKYKRSSEGKRFYGVAVVPAVAALLAYKAGKSSAPAAVKEIKAGKIEYRLDKTNIIHCPIGKASFGAEKLGENFNTLLDAIVKAKPASSKGQYIKSCVVASTMGPGIRINPSKVLNAGSAE